MHDPLVVAHTIRKPWPKVSKRRHHKDGRLRIRYSWRKWYDIRPSVFTVFWYIGPFELYWSSLITIWHREPGGHDSGDVCKHSTRWQEPDGTWRSKRRNAWKWHIHHWKIQVPPLQAIRRRLLTRCEWCGGKGRKRDIVNHSHSWDRAPGHWWQGERGLFHQDCSGIHTAHETCTCAVPVLEHGDYGRCAVCDLFRAWRSLDDAPSPRDETTEILKSIPPGQRDPVKTAQVSALWKAHRAPVAGTSAGEAS